MISWNDSAGLSEWCRSKPIAFIDVGILKLLVSSLLIFALMNPDSLSAADPVNGSSLYQKYCVMCHGRNGESVMPGAPDFRNSSSLFQSDQSLLLRIEQGQGACPAYKGVLRRTEILDLISNLRMMR